MQAGKGMLQVVKLKHSNSTDIPNRVVQVCTFSSLNF